MKNNSTSLEYTEDGKFVVWNAQSCIKYKNFAGRNDNGEEGGNRKFTLILDTEEMYKLAESNGWPIKFTGPEKDIPYIQVDVSYKFESVSPIIETVKGKERAYLTKDNVKMLDWTEITHADIILRNYNWVYKPNNTSGTKPQLVKMRAVLYSDPIEEKYASLGEGMENELPFSINE